MRWQRAPTPCPHLITFNGTNGTEPNYDLYIDASGNLFGTTMSGGANGKGTVFEVPAGTNNLVTLYSFSSATGIIPIGGVIEDSSGDLFGTTNRGGTNNDGTVFELMAGTYTLNTLASFAGSNGSVPPASLYEDSSGDLFGTTLNGGFENNGTVFEVAAGSNTITTLVTFTGTANGSGPDEQPCRRQQG